MEMSLRRSPMMAKGLFLNSFNSSEENLVTDNIDRKRIFASWPVNWRRTNSLGREAERAGLESGANHTGGSSKITIKRRKWGGKERRTSKA